MNYIARTEKILEKYGKLRDAEDKCKFERQKRGPLRFDILRNEIYEKYLDQINELLDDEEKRDVAQIKLFMLQMKIDTEKGL